MAGSVVLGIYLLAAVIAAAILYAVGPRRWYWHALAVLVGLFAGLLREA